ncbi:MAG: DciA family protein [Patescibacteria group bacterium]|jgi:hypothetical protein
MFQRIGGLLTGSLARARITDQAKSAQVMETVSEWLIEQWGREIADIVKPLYVKKKTLILATVNASFASEIRYRQRLLLERISQKHGAGVVESVMVEL